ncbi:MAG TPA: hypothetical protein VGL08_21700 [Paraburkholderia sp.]
MTRRIDATRLAGLELASDGSRFSLRGVDDAGMPWSLRLPTECLQQLILTLPNVAAQALQQLHGDDSLRIVYPAHTTAVELASDLRTFILTLQTEDGFHVSFGLSEEQCERIGNSPRLAMFAPPTQSRPS